MSVPTFQDLMLPLLDALSDGREWSLGQLEEYLAEHFGVSGEERRQVLPSGGQTRFRNRISWAAVHMRKAGIIESPRRGRNRITERGETVLAEGLDRLDMKYLERYSEYRQFKGLDEKEITEPGPDGNLVDEWTPEELMDLGYQRMVSDLSETLLDRIRRSTSDFFESLVLDLLVTMGYGGSVSEAAERVGRSGDGGIDGTIKEDQLGLDVVYVQAKRWQGSVGPNVVREFYGSLAGQRAEKGVLMTTASFTKSAVEFAASVGRIVLVDGSLLAKLMIEHGVGVSQTAVYRVCRVDTDYFEDEE